MDKNIDLNKLITQAKLGDRDDADRLILLVEPRVRAYIYRSTLNNELTDDIVQETLLQMLKSITSLQQVESFWPWVYRIASGKVNDFFRSQKRLREHFSTLEDSLLESVVEDDSQQASESVVHHELAELIVKAMSKLKHQQRAIIALRCFEDMPYSQIAQAIGCSETKARVSFFRAKNAISKHLSSQGFSKSSAVMGLVLFGKLTAPSKAAAAMLTVNAEAIKIGRGLWGILSSFIKSHVIKLAVSTVLVAGIGAWYFSDDAIPQRKNVRSVHFVVQGVDPGSTSSSSVAGDNMAAGFASKGAYENWLSFPDGPDGALIRRKQRWNIERTGKLCSWLQDGNANYYYHAGEQKLYITNDPLGALILPTDSAEFADFILEMVNASSLVEYERDEKTGLLAAKTDSRVAAVGAFGTVYKYNTVAGEVFENDWSSYVAIVDVRDQAHKRGWTYFGVKGQIGGMKVEGLGRIPFVYNMSKKHPAWLKLSIGDNLQIIDTNSGAYLRDSAGNAIAVFASGSFFKGLGRPWLGIRAYDTVRRDAAEKRIRFEGHRHGEKAWVSLLESYDYSYTTVRYDINMEKDLIETITYSITGGVSPLAGKLEFTYLDDVSDFGDEFIEPERVECDLAAQEPLGVLWLLQLIQRNTGKLVKLDVARDSLDAKVN